MNLIAEYFYIFKTKNSDISDDLSQVWIILEDRLCGLVVRVPGYRSRGPGLIPGTNGFSEE
jgi:hypothetical protein